MDKLMIVKKHATSVCAKDPDLQSIYSGALVCVGVGSFVSLVYLRIRYVQQTHLFIAIHIQW